MTSGEGRGGRTGPPASGVRGGSGVPLVGRGGADATGGRGAVWPEGGVPRAGRGGADASGGRGAVWPEGGVTVPTGRGGVEVPVEPEPDLVPVPEGGVGAAGLPGREGVIPTLDDPLVPVLAPVPEGGVGGAARARGGRPRAAGPGPRADARRRADGPCRTGRGRRGAAGSRAAGPHGRPWARSRGEARPWGRPSRPAERRAVSPMLRSVMRISTPAEPAGCRLPCGRGGWEFDSPGASV